VNGTDPTSIGKPASLGTEVGGRLFRRQEDDPMIKALLTPVLLGLGVALLIRMASARRAY
jgi:uncharacterized membrane-anchored protein YitT (DUF2179 family)